MPLSLLTLVRNRTAYLASLLDSLAHAPDPPADVVVAVCGGEDPTPHLPEAPFPVRLLDIGSDGDRIPYSHARNACARAATSDHILFLDADCLPAPSTLAALDDTLHAVDALAIAEVRYLPPGEHDLRGVDALYAESRPHPARPVPPKSLWRTS